MTVFLQFPSPYTILKHNLGSKGAVVLYRGLITCLIVRRLSLKNYFNLFQYILHIKILYELIDNVVLSNLK